MQNKIKEIISNSIDIKHDILANVELLQNIEQVVSVIVTCFKNDGKVLFCGNGGSASDAQHLAAELSGRFYIDRAPLFAEALHVNTSYITAVSNDYGYDQVFSRLVDAFGRKDDILIGLTTSGNSKNIINAFENANKIGMITIAMTGQYGGDINEFCDYLLDIPSKDIPRIQESHIMIGHIICELVEKEIFE
ncbi:MAG: D-sedoheptulose 7-phosphate isomerase [Candidatus Lokiarchaeota archaeon]|nr:D-sedoheptulose 7-phosphate isomerase [Candidatus Lokiarchaeota archaeon]